MACHILNSWITLLPHLTKKMLPALQAGKPLPLIWARASIMAILQRSPPMQAMKQIGELLNPSILVFVLNDVLLRITPLGAGAVLILRNLPMVCWIRYQVCPMSTKTTSVAKLICLLVG